MALAHELEAIPLPGRRIVELGCGLGVPSLAVARGGATVLATDAEPQALQLLERNALENEVSVETAMVDWAAPDELVHSEPFDLVVASDVLYERPSVARLLNLLPLLAPEAWIADPGRPAAESFLERARECWQVETTVRGVVHLHRLWLAPAPNS